ncbi:MAG TPA: AAA family ATPase [Chloroflexota bacterium]|nr:AAA family ATPase [Chloroflexota bacterium]
MHPERTVELNLGVDEHDELDRKIDRALGRVGVLVRTLFVIGVLVALGLFVVYPQWDVLGPFITTGLYLVFQLFYVAFLMIFQFIVLFWFIGRPRIYWLMPGETGVGFKDYKGNPEVLESARQVVTLLKGVKRFKLMGGQPIRGLLLEGPPGTGKSYLGQAIATEAQLPFGYMSAPSIQGMFWGMDTLRVLSLFNKARKLARKHGACILFIDEIDAIGKSRSGVGNAGGFGGMMMGGGGGALNELLNQMDPLPKDGFKDKILRNFGIKKGKADQPPVLTIAATNLVSVLDAALLRPGRFDRQLRVGFPSYDGRREIFDYYLAKVKHVDLPIDQMVAETINYTPAQIKHVVNESVVHAVWNGRDAIDYADFRWALETYEWGMRQPVIGMTYADKRRLSYHEAGHAVASVKLLKRERVARATIEARHDIGAAALVSTKPTEEIHTQTKEELLAHMQISLASRACEQIFLGQGEEMSGASGDLANATRIAQVMVNYLGMNGSLMSAAGMGGFNPMMGAPAGGGNTREIERLLDQNFKKVKMLMEENRAGVIAVAEALIEKHSLLGDEIYELVARADSRTNGHTNGHVTAPPIDAPAFEIAAGGQQRVDPRN